MEKQNIEQLRNNEQKQEVKQEGLSYGSNDLIKMPPFLEAVIVDLETKKAKEIFGEKASKPEQIIIVITYENSEHGLKNTEVFNHYPAGKVPEASKLGKFIAKYNGLKVGLRINLVQKTSGYYGIVIE